jgi:hypothetical protein
MQLWHLVVLSFLAELLEMGWQYAPTLRQVLERVYTLYRRSIFLLLLGHTGYLYLLWLSLYYDVLNWPIILAIALKTLDIFTKIEMVRKLFVRKEYDEVLGEMLEMPFPLWLWLLGPLTYPWLVWLALRPAGI